MNKRGPDSPSNNGPGNGLATTPQEEMLLVHLGLLALLAAIGSAGVVWLKGAAWLVEQGVLVVAGDGPLLVLPASGGAGLDLPRVAIVAGVLLALLAWGVSALRRVWSDREEQA